MLWESTREWKGIEEGAEGLRLRARLRLGKTRQMRENGGLYGRTLETPPWATVKHNAVLVAIASPLLPPLRGLPPLRPPSSSPPVPELPPCALDLPPCPPPPLPACLAFPPRAAPPPTRGLPPVRAALPRRYADPRSAARRSGIAAPASATAPPLTRLGAACAGGGCPRRWRGCGGNSLAVRSLASASGIALGGHAGLCPLARAKRPA